MKKPVRHTAIPEVSVMLFNEGSVFLLKRQNTGYEDGSYCFPAGHIEPDEGPRAAAVREAKEEVGIVIDPKDLNIAHVMYRKSDDERVCFFFAVKKWQGEPSNCEGDKCSEAKWFRLDDLPDNVIPYMKMALKEFLNAKIYSESGW